MPLKLMGFCLERVLQHSPINLKLLLDFITLSLCSPPSFCLFIHTHTNTPLCRPVKTLQKLHKHRNYMLYITTLILVQMKENNNYTTA